MVRIMELFMRKKNCVVGWSVLLLFFLLISLIIIGASYPMKRPFADDLIVNSITINNRRYLMISSNIEEQLRNPLFPIECLDYSYDNQGNIILTKFYIFNLFSLFSNRPILNTLPLMIPYQYFDTVAKTIQVKYWSQSGYKSLCVINHDLSISSPLEEGI